MKKRIPALLATALVGTTMLLGACAPSIPTPDGEQPGPSGEQPAVPETPDAVADAPYADAAATLSLTGAIDKESDANKISSDLFGLFLEDINYASFAMDDNLLINGSFANRQPGGTNVGGGKTYAWSGDGITIVTTNEGGVLSGNDAFRNYDGTYINAEHAKLLIDKANAKLINTGHPRVPMAVEEGVAYVFSAFIKGYDGKVTLNVTDGKTVYATGEIDVSGNEWIKYQTTLTATGSCSNGLKFEMVFASTSQTAEIDNVKLETTDVNAKTGIKSYLYDKVAALSPKFFRFPGGCIIEGLDDSSYYDWKNSIGAVASTKEAGGDTVPGFTYKCNVDGQVETVTTYGEQATRTYNTDLWGVNWAGGGISSVSYYQMEYGLGYYEYFLLCEELGAKAIPIVNCGLSCQVRNGHALKGRHEQGKADFVEDALDLIAFAKGDPNSSDPREAKWAKIRADMGHPEPFEMDYIGYGNEQWSGYYDQYYEKFLNAQWEEGQDNPLYLSVRPIVGNCTMFTNCENPKTDENGNAYVSKGAAQSAAEAYMVPSTGNITDYYQVKDYGVVDQHYYVNFTDFFQNHDLYDNYGRPADDPDGYYDVFVGEYAANTDIARSHGGENVIPVSAGDAQNTRFRIGNAAGESTWINALSEAAMMTGMERNGDIVKLAAYAPMFGNLTAGRQWAVDMMYFDNTAMYCTPSYYVQQLFMQNSGDYKVDSTLAYAGGTPLELTFSGTGNATRVVNQLYYVTSMDEETGDILIKIVNAGEDKVKLNISLAGLEGVQLSDIAEVREVIGSSYEDKNSLTEEAVFPVKSRTIGNFQDGNKFGYEVKALSVTAIRVRTR